MINNNADKLLNEDSLIVVYDDDINNTRFYTSDFYSSTVNKTIPGIVFDSIELYNRFCLSGDIVPFSFIHPVNVFTINTYSWSEQQDGRFFTVFKIQIGDGKEYVDLTYRPNETTMEKLLFIMLKDINEVFKCTSIEAYINENKK